MNIVVMTGAGISAESGLKTFRDENGLWEGYRMEDVATFEAFRSDPGLVHDFYNARRRQLLTVEPNAAHRSLAEFEKLSPQPASSRPSAHPATSSRPPVSSAPQPPEARTASK